jgi:hypothetical protein
MSDSARPLPLSTIALGKPVAPKTTQLPIERFVYEPLSTDTFSVALNGAVAAFLTRLDLLEPTEAREEFCRAFRTVAFFVDKRGIGNVELRVQASAHISDNRLHEAPIYFTQRMTAEKMAAAVETAYDMLTAALDIYSSVFLFVRPAFVHPAQIKADECVYIALKTDKSSFAVTDGWRQFLTARSRVLHRETLALEAQFASKAAPTPPADEPPLDVPAPPSRARRLRQYLIALFSCAPRGWTRL